MDRQQIVGFAGEKYSVSPEFLLVKEVFLPDYHMNKKY